MKNYQLILLAVFGFGLTYTTIYGITQKYIYFAGEMNELFFATVCFMLGTMGLIGIDYKKLIKGLL
jgi:hypothetical protein